MLRNALLITLFVATAVGAQDNETATEEGCSICAENKVVTKPDTIVRENTAGFTLANQTCGEIEDLATSGSYSYYECMFLNVSAISETCGCSAPTEPPSPNSGAASASYGIAVLAAAAAASLFLN